MRKHDHVAQRQQRHGDGLGGQDGMSGHCLPHFLGPTWGPSLTLQNGLAATGWAARVRSAPSAAVQALAFCSRYTSRACCRRRSCARRGTTLTPSSGQFEHGVDRRLLHDRAQPARQSCAPGPLRAIATSAEGRISSSTRPSKRVAGICLTSAFFGSVRMRTSASSDSSPASPRPAGRRRAPGSGRLDQVLGFGPRGRSRHLAVGLALHRRAEADARTVLGGSG